MTRKKTNRLAIKEIVNLKKLQEKISEAFPDIPPEEVIISPTNWDPPGILIYTAKKGDDITLQVLDSLVPIDLG